MKISYFDCFSGIAGDMIIGALLDAGLEISALKKELKKLPLTGYQIKAFKTEKKGIKGTKFEVKAPEEKIHRNLKDIFKIIDKSSLDKKIRDDSKKIFRRLAEAEAKVHGVSVDKIHFHEVGGVDAIIDIVGAVIGLDILKVDKIYSSPLSFGKGYVKFSHGKFPVPAPATVELCKDIPVRYADIEGELVTPTGAAIVTTLADFSPRLDLKIEKVGYGAGSADLKEIPNLLRVVIGQKEQDLEQDEILVLETNIDNTTPEVLGYLTEKLLQKGALDVYLVPIIMKKGRPGTILSVLCNANKLNELSSIIFSETGTIGFRTQFHLRKKLPRKIEVVNTRFGKARVKVITYGEKVHISPEFEDCRALADKNKIALREVYREVEKNFWSGVGTEHRSVPKRRREKNFRRDKIREE
ncbi:MAG: nickel pincer cofactor biosynthesis protein LarC [candidate division Zixibacteria bacterium]|nr:nickel pincer cofactor biosynthesis protein LarC [candidate division Zixibacteria bacterium]